MKFKEIVNLTPYKLKIIGRAEPIEPSGMTARLNANLIKVCEVDGIPIMASINSGVSNLPQPKDGVLYITAAYIRQACPERKDLASPAKLIRDDRGGVVGCAAFEVNP
jgi:hypothetical protein